MMTKTEFEAALAEVDMFCIDEDTDTIAGEAVCVTRSVDKEYDSEADVVSGTETLYVTWLATGATYMNVGTIYSSYGSWVDTDFGDWEEV